MSTKPAPRRASWALLVILVVALAIGAAASILVEASTAPPPPSGTASLVMLPDWMITDISFAMIILFFGTLVIYRLGRGPAQPLGRFTATVLVAILIGILLVALTHFLGGGGVLGGGGGGGGSSGGAGKGANPPPTGSLSGPGGVIVIPGLPAWVPFVALGVIVLAVALVATPYVREYVEARQAERARRGRAESVPEGLRGALAQASTELDLGDDPREVILRLYAEMLRELQPMVTDIGPSTPEEIRSNHLVRLGVRAEAARTLTRLFEEARYSPHPMGETEGARARRAVRETIEDLTRRPSPP